MGKDLKKLRQSRIDKAKAGKSALAEFNTLGAKADRTADEDARLEALTATLEALEGEVEAIDADIAAEEKSAKLAGLFGTSAITPPAFGIAARSLAPNPETTYGFKSMAHFARSVADGSAEAVMEAAAPSTYNRGSGSSGEGYLVPPEYSDKVWDIAFSQDDLLAMSNPEPTASNTFLQPKDETTPWGSSGVQAYWRDEASTMTPTKYAVGANILQLHELYAFTAATNELMADAPLLENRLTFQAGRAIQWKASDAIMWGTGAGQPLGFMKSPALVTVNKDAGQAAATLSVANLANMLARILRVGGKPMWIAHTDILPQLIQLTIGNFPAWLPNNQPLQANPWDGTLLGYPLMFSEHAQTLGTVGDINCVNMVGYHSLVKAQGGLEFATSMHLYFDANMQAFRWTFRLGGVPILAAAIARKNGASTLSHFVTLQAR